MSSKIRTTDKLKALAQWTVLIPIFALGIILTMVLGWAVILTARKQPASPFGKTSPQPHSEKYIQRGSSGSWDYFMTTVPVLKWFGNLEDGLYGEPSGKNSANLKGKERSFLGMYYWLWRNPFNYAKRMTPFLACFVNECDVVSKGDTGVTDKRPDGSGSYWVIGIHRNPKWWHWTNYYGFRHVIIWDTVPTYVKITGLLSKIPGVRAEWFTNKVYNAVLGFKIKPEHAEGEQDEDDRDKSTTFRITPFATVD